MFRGIGTPSQRSSSSPAKPRPVKMPRQQHFTPSCTHLTMTRYYTKKLRCQQCMRLGSFGWLYRCTQDRELLLEEDHDIFASTDEGIDAMLGRSDTVLRSPAARHDKLAFFSELTPEQFASYSDEQVNILLDQRAHILEVAFAESQPIPEIFVTAPSSPDSSESPPKSPTPPPPKNPNKPWLNMTPGECQFKCCHRCRPFLQERSYLSLVGIAKNDIPMTAITGFGFHTREYLPYSNPEHVKNLGLRPNPLPRVRPLSMGPRRAYAVIREDEDEEMPDAPELPPRPKSWTLQITNNPPSPHRTGSPEENRAIIAEFLAKLTRDPNISSSSSSTDIASKYATKQLPTVPVSKVLTSNLNAPTSTFSHQRSSSFSSSSHPQPLSSHPPRIIRPKPGRSNLSLAVAISTPLPDDDDEGLLTAMEAAEAHEGSGVFGSRPLVVNDGVAVMEEGVGGHFADLMDVDVDDEDVRVDMKGKGKGREIYGDEREEGEIYEGVGGASSGLESIMTQV